MAVLATAESEVIPEFSFFTDNVLGIAVGVVLTVVALFTVFTVLTLCCMYRKRFRKRKRKPDEER